MNISNLILEILLTGMASLLIPGKGMFISSTDNSNPQKYSTSTFSIQETQKNRQGYIAVTGYRDGFIAVGSDGRLDRFSASGSVLKSETYKDADFNCILSYDRIVVAAGDNGNIMISAYGEALRKIESGTDRNINSIVFFNGQIIASADQGEIIIADEMSARKKIQLPLKGNIVSVSAGPRECYGVTDEGEIINSSDGITWDILDFNKVYSGYYKQCFFKKILVSENSIVVAGVRKDGSPVLLYSIQGNVWTEKTLYYTDENGTEGILKDTPNDILYDSMEDQLYLVCDKGRVMILPSCTQCNQLAVISQENLTGISLKENMLLIVGDNYFIKAVNIR